MTRDCSERCGDAEVQRSRRTDIARANEAAGLARTPVEYTWHHHQTSGLMQLIRSDIHRGTGHPSGFLAWGVMSPDD